MGHLVEADAGERAGLKRHLHDLQECCRFKRRKVPDSVVEACGLAIEWVDDALVVSPGAVDVADARIDELTEQLASTKVEVILITSKLYGLEEVCNKAKLEPEELLEKERTVAKTSGSVLERSKTVLFLAVMSCCV